MVCDDSFIIALQSVRICAEPVQLIFKRRIGLLHVGAYRGVVSEHVDQINTIFAAVNAIDTCPNPAYAIDILFFSNRIFVVIMYNRKALISRLFF